VGADVHRSVVLQVGQSIVIDIYEKFIEAPDRTSNQLLVALANLTFVLTEIFTDEPNTDSEEEADLYKTEGTIWTSIKGRYQSVLSFFSTTDIPDENMPQLRKEQF
jgi:hypothetical protein